MNKVIILLVIPFSFISIRCVDAMKGAVLNQQALNDALFKVIDGREGSSEKITSLTALIKKGADVNAQNQKGYTPLICAALKGLTEVSQVLIEMGANINAQNEDRETPFICAEKGGHIKVRNVVLRGMLLQQLMPSRHYKKSFVTFIGLCKKYRKDIPKGVLALIIQSQLLEKQLLWVLFSAHSKGKVLPKIYHEALFDRLPQVVFETADLTGINAAIQSADREEPVDRYRPTDPTNHSFFNRLLQVPVHRYRSRVSIKTLDDIKMILFSTDLPW